MSRGLMPRTLYMLYNTLHKQAIERNIGTDNGTERNDR